MHLLVGRRERSRSRQVIVSNAVLHSCPLEQTLNSDPGSPAATKHITMIICTANKELVTILEIDLILVLRVVLQVN